MIKKILPLLIILLLTSSPSWGTAVTDVPRINWEPVASILTDEEGNGAGVYILFNFAFTYLMKYMFAPVALFKCVLLVLETGGDKND